MPRRRDPQIDFADAPVPILGGLAYLQPMRSSRGFADCFILAGRAEIARSSFPEPLDLLLPKIPIDTTR